jgi:hypothetical protein
LPGGRREEKPAMDQREARHSECWGYRPLAGDRFADA